MEVATADTLARTRKEEKALRRYGGPMGIRMKQLEDESASLAKLDLTKPFAIPLDGKNFSTFTRPFERFDIRRASPDHHRHASLGNIWWQFISNMIVVIDG